MPAAMKKPDPIDTERTWVLPEDEVAARRTTDTETTTTKLRKLTVHEVEQCLLSVDDETRTDLQPILESEDPAK
jgi:hypothetical protein